MSDELPLGKPTEYRDQYAPELLVGIPRQRGRERLGLGQELPFHGVDVWTAHELSWLDPRGKPVVATGEFWIPADSPSIVESKSLKLYLNSLNGMRSGSMDEVRDTIQRDLDRVVGGSADVTLTAIPRSDTTPIRAPLGTCIDDHEVDIQSYDVDSGLLRCRDGDEAEETLYSNLLKSNCPITQQPDWATVVVRYRGAPIDPAALLRYIVSYRNHDEFHEHCVERIFTDLQKQCGPRALSVLARYTRRGGIDINPFRSDFETLKENGRFWRQ